MAIFALYCLLIAVRLFCLAEICSAQFRLSNIKYAVRLRLIRMIQQFILKFKKLVFEIEIKTCFRRFCLVSEHCFMRGAKQIGKIRNLRIKISVAFHRNSWERRHPCLLRRASRRKSLCCKFNLISWQTLLNAPRPARRDACAPSQSLASLFKRVKDKVGFENRKARIA